jgi:hypothetical protein
MLFEAQLVTDDSGVVLGHVPRTITINTRTKARNIELHSQSITIHQRIQLEKEEHGYSPTELGQAESRANVADFLDAVRPAPDEMYVAAKSQTELAFSPGLSGGERFAALSGAFGFAILAVAEVFDIIPDPSDPLVRGAAKEAKNVSYLYRGVPSGTERGKLAKQGIVKPRGTSNDYMKHVRGEDVATDATSWTRDPSVARRYGDIILKAEESKVKSKIIPHPDPGLYPDEQEVLLRGTLEGLERVE